MVLGRTGSKHQVRRTSPRHCPPFPMAPAAPCCTSFTWTARRFVPLAHPQHLPWAQPSSGYWVIGPSVWSTVCTSINHLSLEGNPCGLWTRGQTSNRSECNWGRGWALKTAAPPQPFTSQLQNNMVWPDRPGDFGSPSQAWIAASAGLPSLGLWERQKVLHLKLQFT
jgi:hypothetical protein